MVSLSSVEQQNPSTRSNAFVGDDGYVIKGMLVTRPFKIQQPDVLKTIYKIYQRGKLRKGSVKQALYASRDLYQWDLVDSSMNERLVGMAGTPYKYFILALVCDMQADERLHGFSLEFRYKYGNSLR